MNNFHMLTSYNESEARLMKRLPNVLYYHGTHIFERGVDPLFAYDKRRIRSLQKK